MPYALTSSMKQEMVKLTQDQLVECYILDLASIKDYMSFQTSTHKIIARDIGGIFPTNRIKVGDIVEVYNTVSNNGTYTITNVTNKEVTVSESLVNENTVLGSITNYAYFVKNQYDIVGYKMRDSEIINTNQLYTGTSITRENFQTDLKSPNKRAAMKITVGNVNRILESLIQTRSYLRGCFVYLIEMFAKHFPTGAGYTYIGSTPDYLSNMLEKLIVDSVSSNEQLVSFNCKHKFFFSEVALPGRVMDRSFCAWAVKYKGVECDPTNSINAITFPTCDGTLQACRDRGNTLRFGGFPSIPREGIYV